MPDCERVSKTWHSPCTPRSERQHFPISKPDTMDSWPLTPSFHLSRRVTPRPVLRLLGGGRRGHSWHSSTVLCWAMRASTRQRRPLTQEISVKPNGLYGCVCAEMCVQTSSTSHFGNNRDYRCDFNVARVRAYPDFLPFALKYFLLTNRSLIIWTKKVFYQFSGLYFLILDTSGADWHG